MEFHLYSSILLPLGLPFCSSPSPDLQRRRKETAANALPGKGAHVTVGGRQKAMSCPACPPRMCHAYAPRISLHATLCPNPQMPCLGLLGVNASCARWAVFAELGAKPYHYYWIKALVRFQASIVQSNSPLLADVARADAQLAADVLPDGRRCTTCWSAELSEALESIGGAAGLAAQGTTWADTVRQGTPLACRPAILDATLAAYDRIAWHECSGAHASVRSAQLPPGVPNPNPHLLCLLQAHTT